MQVKIDQIRADGGTQIRSIIAYDDVKEYAAEMKRGVRFPAIVVFFDGTDYWLADGFHRLNAAMELGEKKTIACTVKKGTVRDARLYACASNTSHGLPRTNRDKRRAVETLLNDTEWSKWSDREIAKRCAVHHSLVSRVRGQLSVAKRQMRGKDATTVKTRRGGAEYEMDTSGLRRSDGNGRARPTTERKSAGPVEDDETEEEAPRAPPVTAPAMAQTRQEKPEAKIVTCHRCGHTHECVVVG
jgi:hypothetical protein